MFRTFTNLLKSCNLSHHTLHDRAPKKCEKNTKNFEYVHRSRWILLKSRLAQMYDLNVNITWSALSELGWFSENSDIIGTSGINTDSKPAETGGIYVSRRTLKRMSGVQRVQTKEAAAVGRRENSTWNFGLKPLPNKNVTGSGVRADHFRKPAVGYLYFSLIKVIGNRFLYAKFRISGTVW